MPAKKKYICSGICDKCELRFKCLTDKGYVIEVEWNELHAKYKGSPSIALKKLTGGKVFVDGSRKFIKFFQR